MVEPVAATVRIVLKHVFGLLGKETRGRFAKQFKHGNVTDEECRHFIVTELDNILGNFSGIGREDLLSSLCFLQDGVNELYQSLHLSHSESSGSVTGVEAVSSSGAEFYSSVSDAVALVNRTQPLISSEYFKSSTRNFMLAQKIASKALSNEALSVKDRIQAYQVRMIAKILENPENPNVGVSDCLRHFNQLADIHKVLSFPQPGLLGIYFHRKNRPSIVTAVEAVKPDFFDFAIKFMKLTPNTNDRSNVSHDETLYNFKILDSVPKATFDEGVNLESAVKKSEGANTWKEYISKMFGIPGKSPEPFDDPKEATREWTVCAMDVDKDDNIYIITASREKEGESFRFDLFMFDSNGNQTREFNLDFKNHLTPAVSMALNKKGKIAILDRVNKKMYYGHPSSNLETYKAIDVNEVPLSTYYSPKSMRFFYSDGIKIVVLGQHTVYIYNVNGKFEGEIGIPDEHGTGVFLEIDDAKRRFLIETWRPVKDIFSLKSEKYEQSVRTSHRSVVLFWEQGLDYLQPL